MTEKFDVELHFDDATDLVLQQLSNTDVAAEFSTATMTSVTNIGDIEDYDGSILVAHDVKNAMGRTWETKVATITNWPEFKTKTCYKYKWGVKIPYPCLWRRTCKKSWYLRISYDGTASLPKDIDRMIQDCAKKALLPALPVLLTGNVGGAVGVFWGSFKACMASKIPDVAGFKVGFFTKSEYTEWKRV